MTTLQDIGNFLALRRLAVVGVSRHASDFSRVLFRELRQRGYDLVPVNPALTEVDGIPCEAIIADISPPVEGALLLTSPSVTDKVLADCAHAGIHHVWLYRASGAGAVSPSAISFCEAHGISVVGGECPLMFLTETGWIHRLHGFCRTIMGTYPPQTGTEAPHTPGLHTLGR
ncbi:MAG TPA: CoA-binding protein [Candidatus Acidoferrales bacterium]|jgi:predicted CoA-binding protein|nr:CoA-binding protein [Candidatus Acidoferrales bacterium]